MDYFPGGLVCFRRPEIKAKMNHVAACLVKHDAQRAAP
jgi:hypothetical protein